MSKSIPTISLSEIVYLPGSQHLIIGHSGSGKTTFLKSLLNNIKEPKDVHIYGHDLREWRENKKINFHISYPFEDKSLLDLSDCIVVFDDFALKKKYEEDFYRFTNYNVRHFKITFIMICHSIYKSNLYSKILSSPSIFLTASQSNLFLVQKYDKMFTTKYTKILKDNIEQQPPFNRHILYLASSYAVNKVEQLFQTTFTKCATMFRGEKVFYLLDIEKYEIEDTETKAIENYSKLDEILSEFKELYPKKFKRLKKFIELLYNHLEQNSFLNLETLTIVMNNKEVSLYDFIIASQNFSKQELDPRIKYVLQHLKRQNFKVPRFTLQNSTYKTFIT